jgi:hypothetical protein
MDNGRKRKLDTNCEDEDALETRLNVLRTAATTAVKLLYEQKRKLKVQAKDNETRIREDWAREVETLNAKYEGQIKSNAEALRVEVGKFDESILAHKNRLKAEHTTVGGAQLCEETTCSAAVSMDGCQHTGCERNGIVCTHHLELNTCSSPECKKMVCFECSGSCESCCLKTADTVFCASCIAVCFGCEGFMCPTCQEVYATNDKKLWCSFCASTDGDD